MKYLAHSKDTENDIPTQYYGDHIYNVYCIANSHLNRLQNYMEAENFSIIKKMVLNAAIYHDLGKLDDQPQKILSSSNTIEDSEENNENTENKVEVKMLNHVEAGITFFVNLYNKTKKMEHLGSALLVYAHHIGLPNFKEVIEKKREAFIFKWNLTEKIHCFTNLEKYGMENKNKNNVKAHVDENLSEYIKRHEEEMSEFQIEDLNFEVNQSKCKRFMSDYMCMMVALSVLVDSDHEDTTNHYEKFNKYPVRKLKLNPDEKIKNLDNYIDNLQKNSKASKERLLLRNKFYDYCKKEHDEKVSLIDGVVGIGKTTGLMRHSLVLAKKHNLDTIHVILPYIALIEQSSEEYRKCLFDNKLNKNSFELNEVHSLFKTNSIRKRKYQKGFNAPINITTSINFFHTLSSNHVSIIKNIHKFAGSVIAIDEYHTIAEHHFWSTMLEMIKSLSDNFSSHFVLSSGTPIKYWDLDVFEAQNIDLKVNEIIDKDSYESMLEQENKRVKIDVIDGLVNFQFLLDIINSKNGSFFIVFNTVRKALKFFNYIQTKTERKVFARHSALSPYDRIDQFENVKKLLANKEDLILIATLGSDVGLDLSFNHGLKEIAHSASANQAKGRINRGGEYNDSTLTLFELEKYPSFDGDRLYDNPSCISPAKIFKSEKRFHKYLCPKYTSLIAEEELHSLINQKKNGISIKFFMRNLLSNYKNQNYKEFSDEFNLINTPTISVLVDHGIKNKILKGIFVSYQDIQRSMVNIFMSEKNMEIISDKIIKIEEYENNLSVENMQKNVGGIYVWEGEYDPVNYGIYKDPCWEICDLELFLA